MIESSCVHTSLISRTFIFIETQQPNTTTKPKKKKPTKQTKYTISEFTANHSIQWYEMLFRKFCLIA